MAVLHQRQKIMSAFFFSATHSHTTSQRCQSWGAACTHTLQVFKLAWRLENRPAAHAFFFFSFLSLWKFLVVPPTACRGTSGKATIAQMGVLPAHSWLPTQPALICLAAHARFLYPDNHGALSFNREKEMKFKCQR